MSGRRFNLKSPPNLNSKGCDMIYYSKVITSYLCKSHTQHIQNINHPLDSYKDTSSNLIMSVNTAGHEMQGHPLRYLFTIHIILYTIKYIHFKTMPYMIHTLYYSLYMIEYSLI